MKRLFLTTLIVLSPIIQANATQTWCAVVNTNVPGNELNMRGGPGTEYPTLVKLRPGEYIEIDTGRCSERFNAQRAVVGRVCIRTESRWAFVENVPSFGEGTREQLGGWINTQFVTQVTCRH